MLLVHSRVSLPSRVAEECEVEPDTRIVGLERDVAEVGEERICGG